MKKSTTRLCTGMLLAAAAQVHAGVDAKLLDMLLANGSITKAQHAELSADLAREQGAAKKAAADTVSKKEFTEFRQLAGWAANTALRGDMRVRQETIEVEARPGDDTTRDRQRIRARLAAVTQVNPEIEVGMQIASGNNADRRSTNQDLDNYFDRKSLWLDLAYIDYHPAAVAGLKLFGGKMKQPWMAVGDVAWDSDINPEGFAAAYQKKTGAATLFGSTGYFVLKDNVDGEGFEMSHDLSLLELQGGVTFDPSESMRLTLGATVNEFQNESQGFPPAPTVALRGNGNTTDRFRLGELFGQLDVIGLPLPLTIYGQYVQNFESRDLTVRTSSSVTTYEDGGEDTAFLFGLRTNIAGIALDYNYRDVEANAVVGTLTDSDFAGGFTNNSGHKFKAQYDFLKNANVSLTYYMAESNVINPVLEDIDVDTLHLDLNAKF